MSMVALTLMVVVADQSVAATDVNQGLFEPVRCVRGLWHIIGLHFHQSSLFVNVSRMEDQPGLCHMVIDTI